MPAATTLPSLRRDHCANIAAGLDGASAWAQGGIAAVLDGSDSIEDHVRDTHVAGAGLCDEAAVRFVVERGRQSVDWLVAQGVPFTREGDEESLHLTREGGHSHRRRRSLRGI